jgi:AraC family transcriptional regulator
MDQPALSAADLVGVYPAPPQTSAAWDAFTLHVVEPPVQASVKLSHHVLTLNIAGKSRTRQEIGGRTSEGWCGPGSVHVVPAQLEVTVDARDRSGTTRLIVLFVPDAFLSRVIEQDWGAERAKVELATHFLVRDSVVESLLPRLAEDAARGSPFGQLYAESACEFLAHHLVHSYSSLSAPPPTFCGGLPARRLKDVLEYIEENLAQPIALRDLAQLAGVSARHFQRAFRQTVGTPPHAYVLSRRIAAAQHLLIDQPALTVEQIAERIGFSSASHLASAFRRHIGCSPQAFRRKRSN